MKKEILPAYEYEEEIASLFGEYTDMLLEGDSSIAGFLANQNYHQEARHLREKYVLPRSCFYILLCDGKAAGCVGLMEMDEERCEMKRLYIRPEYRRQHLGELLVEKVLEDARHLGYEYMYLDTLPFLQGAIYLYEKYGFYQIPKYKGNMAECSLYMRRKL